jgi:hypothetical protein
MHCFIIDGFISDYNYVVSVHRNNNSSAVQNKKGGGTFTQITDIFTLAQDS